MPKERESYRDNMELLIKAFPSKKMLTKTEASQYLGLDRRTVAKRFTFRNGYISLATLAREMS